jgi:hypothetical protein
MQSLPHSPQFRTSLLVLTHVPLQFVWFGAQQMPFIPTCPVGQQIEFVQTWVPLHGTPHAPQCSGSFVVFRHPAPGQHELGGVHCIVHESQCASLFSTQLESQQSCPGVHGEQDPQ